jgi:hypothetical protein
MKGAWRVARWVLLVAALVAVVGGLLTLAIWVLPGVLVGPARTGLTETDRLKALNDARSSLVTVVGGLLLFTGALIGAYLTSRTIHVNRQGQITDRFTRAIDQLGQHGEDKLDVRLGASTRWSASLESPRRTMGRSWRCSRPISGSTPVCSLVELPAPGRLGYARTFKRSPRSSDGARRSDGDRN